MQQYLKDTLDCKCSPSHSSYSKRAQRSSIFQLRSIKKNRPGTKAIPEVALQKVKYNPLVPKENTQFSMPAYSG